MHFVTADVGGSGVLENSSRRVLASPKVDTSTVLAAKTSAFLEGEAITGEAPWGGRFAVLVVGLF